MQVKDTDEDEAEAEVGEGCREEGAGEGEGEATVKGELATADFAACGESKTAMVLRDAVGWVFVWSYWVLVRFFSFQGGREEGWTLRLRNVTTSPYFCRTERTRLLSERERGGGWMVRWTDCEARWRARGGISEDGYRWMSR